MPVLPFEGMDPDSPGSRFTWRPAIAVQVGEQSERDRVQGRTALSSIQNNVGEWALEPDPELGQTQVLDGGVGRGAEGWAPVLEWIGLAAGAGIMGGLSWEASKAAARAAGRILSRVRKREANQPKIYVSRGFAALLALDAIVAREPSAVLAIETADEPSAFATHPTPELNYVGIEPWIILIVDFHTNHRWIVVVEPTGSVAGMLDIPLGELESMYSRVEPPPLRCD